MDIPILVPIFLWVNNQSAIALVENSIFHTCLKHIKVHHHWVHEKIEDGIIQLEYVPMADQMANICMLESNAFFPLGGIDFISIVFYHLFLSKSFHIQIQVDRS